MPSTVTDTGEVPPALAAVLASYAEDRSRYVDLLEVLATSRLIVPVLEVPASHGTAEATEDAASCGNHDRALAAALIRRGDGLVGLVAFTSVAALTAWRPDARPMPMPTREAAQTAVHEQAQALVIDVAGPTRVVVQGEDLLGLAAGWHLVRVGERSGWIRTQPE